MSTYDDLATTAIHEAGHAVSHVRLGIQQLRVSVVPDGERLGSVLGECDEWTREGAEDMAIAFAAGYAAVIAAGLPSDQAAHGCGPDFDNVERLAANWKLDGGASGVIARAVDLMVKPENRRAVQLVASHLRAFRTFDGDYLGALVELSDGEISPEEFDRYVALRGDRPELVCLPDPEA